MKNNTSFQICNLLALVIIITITTISTTAQISSKPEVPVKDHTGHQKYALHSFTVQVEPDPNEEKFIVSISNPFGETLNISVTGNASPRFSDKTSKLTYRKRISMSAAEDGDYTLIVSGDKNFFTKTITLTSTTYTRNLTLQ